MVENSLPRGALQLCRPVMVGPSMHDCAVAIHVGVATDIQRGDQPDQQDKRQSDSVRVSPRPMDAEAAEREASSEDEGDEHFLRHRGAYRVNRLRLHEQKATIAGRSQQTSESAIRKDYAFDRFWRFPASRLLDGVEHNDMSEPRP
jgi:hypothetical protein